MAKFRKEKTEKAKEQKTTKKKLLSRDNKKTKKKRELHYYGPIEFSFNFLSLVLVIFVGIYFGGRSFYYYSLQNRKTKETAMTLNGLLLNNNKLMKAEEEGLHQDEDGYFFKGNVQNNYVWFANRMFRVMRVDSDDSVKLVTEDLVSSFMWGESAEYSNSNLRYWLTDIKDKDVTGIYYKTIPSQDRFVQKTKYTIDKMVDTKVETGDVFFDDDIVTITLGDYIEAGGKNSFLNNGKLYFILGYNDNDENLYIEEDGSIMSCDYMDGYGIRAVFTMKKNIPVSQGDGTKDNPYVIDQGNDTNYVDSYVKLGDDTWKVYEETDGVIKMYLNGYLKINGEELVRNYSDYDNRFNYFAEDNIGSYLYNDYMNSLSYKDYLTNAKFPYGEISDEVGHTFLNAYKDVYTERIGLLNIFDYVSNNELSNFFRDNTGGQMSTTQYSVAANGLLEEAEVTDQKHVVPVIAIKTSSIKSGNGRIDNPYVVE
ncbi:MAG: hypothetical protein IKF71_00945 [Bacilli bacterium]|nr:hypothetical protein [Bacilli bacterium]